MSEYTFKNVEKTKAKKKFKKSVVKLFQRAKKMERKQSEIVTLNRFIEAMTAKDESLLPNGITGKEPRSTRPGVQNCKIALMTAIVLNWWDACAGKKDALITCSKYKQELERLLQTNEVDILGDLVKGYYAYVR